MTAPNDRYWQKSAKDYKRWLEEAEQRERVLRDALVKISTTYALNQGPNYDGNHLRAMARSALLLADVPSPSAPQS